MIDDDLDFAPPPRWRRIFPRWLRNIIWLDAAAHYDAFLSYSWKSDGETAPVIQSVIHRFLCPWYKVRARTVFRDRSHLAAGGDFPTEIRKRIDRSDHFVALASPEAAASRGMELEAAHWFSRPRKGELVIVVTSGDADSWPVIRDSLVPPTLRARVSEPIWVDSRICLQAVARGETGPAVRAQLVESLRQLFLRLYPGRDWGQLLGEERRQRRRALRLLSAALIAFVGLSVALSFLWRDADRSQRIAVAQRLAAQAQLLVARQPAQAERGALLGVEAMSRFGALGLRSVQADQSLRGALALLPGRLSAMKVELGDAHDVVTFSPNGHYLLVERDGRASLHDVLSRTILGNIQIGKSIVDYDRPPLTRLATFSTQSTQVAIEFMAGDQRAIVVLETATMREVGRVMLADRPSQLALSPDDRYLVATYGDRGQADVWTLADRSHASAFQFGRRVRELAFDPGCSGSESGREVVPDSGRGVAVGVRMDGQFPVSRWVLERPGNGYGK